ncbi:unannotated protein [freshwater metagenome]|uniref:Unannotated protein n=1 Tax=freshwater metagenome TaxID=449393 RepID=A0A6J7JSE5_9ZZZZ|nr:hypothetical protein [Actinomycetota bacterium]
MERTSTGSQVRGDVATRATLRRASAGAGGTGGHAEVADRFRRTSDRALDGLVAEIARSGRTG